MLKLDLNSRIDMPPLPVLKALAEQNSDGVVLFRDDGAVAVASAHMLQLLQPGDGSLLGVDKQMLELARTSGSWSGSLPVGERVVNAHLTHHAHAGRSWYLGLVHEIEGHEDYQSQLLQRHAELRQAYLRLNGTQEKLLQSEKMASIGQLAAGVAHEINNPIGYVHSNLGSLQEYLRSLFTVIEAYERALHAPDPKQMLPEIEEIRGRLDIDFITRDLPQLLAESREGIERVTRIVRDLKDFSYSGRGDSMRRVDLHAGLESTINIIWNELKYKVTLERRYAELPLIECLPSELNQVWMNLLLNAGHAIGERGSIVVSTGQDGDMVWVQFRDSGSGIAADVLKRVFDPFFTTKPVGSGTGLGLSISYSIINKHHGRIDVESTVGEGSTFRVWLPVNQPASTTGAA